MKQPELQKYFWEIDADSLNPKKNHEYIISRILEYGDKEAQNLYNELKAIFKLKSDDEKEAYVRDRLIKEAGLSSNAQNFRVKWNGNNELNMQTSAYARDLGKRFVKKTSYGYELNQDELKKAFGNRENYLDIARNIEIKE